MKPLEIIQADSVSGYNPNVHITWEDPITGEEKWAQGEFAIVNEQYSHIVTDEEGNELYEVRGSNE